ncbi:MAG: type II secretion system protein [Candidatus Gastranaerophilales bacterium]|nr:type II secretion system protein [Candidatus Gastranaerophilales bacterium]
MKRAFTLAEVLITLVIIGVIAALTIPALIKNTQGKEFQVAFKKSLSVLNQAIIKENTLEGKTMEDFTSVADLSNNFFKKQFSILSAPDSFSTDNADDSYDAFNYKYTPIHTLPLIESPAYAGGASAINDDDFIYTADGIGFYVQPGSIGDCEYDPDGYSAPCFYVTVDVNGKQAPNMSPYDGGGVAGTVALLHSIIEQPAFADAGYQGKDLYDRIPGIALYKDRAIAEAYGEYLLKDDTPSSIGGSGEL